MNTTLTQLNITGASWLFRLSFALLMVLGLSAGGPAVAADLKGIHPSINDLSPLQFGEPTLFENDELHMDVTYQGKVYALVLIKNDKLLRNARSSVLATESSVYKGHIQGLDGSWVRLTRINDNYVGAFFDGTELILVDRTLQAVPTAFGLNAKRNSKLLSSRSVAFNASSVHALGQCGKDPRSLESGVESTDLLDVFNTDPRDVRAFASKEINITLVVDTEYAAIHGDDTTSSVLAQMNIVDGIFSEQLGLSMAVLDVVELASNGPMTSRDAEELLVSFRNYVNAEMRNTGLTHLFTGKDIRGSVKGIAYLNSACGSFGVGVTEARSMDTIVALTAAHEFGHNLGAPHDNQSGSACSSTPGTFLMNPLLNGSDQFSACSLDIMESVISRSRCVADISNPSDTPPLFSSTPNLTTTANRAYQYDDDGQLEAFGSEGIRFELDFGPAGMVVDSLGVVSWTPGIDQVGVHAVQVTAINDYGVDTQTFDIEVQSLPPIETIDFNDTVIDSYAGAQDANGIFSVEDDGRSLHMTGNTWKKIDFLYTVTAETILEFEFSSTAIGEIHGIGLDDDLALSADRTFNLYGLHSFGINDFKYSGSGAVERFVIPLGQYFTGEMDYLFFALDHDVDDPTGSHIFSNVRIYESWQQLPDVSPVFESEPNLQAQINQTYEYDADGRASAVGSADISFSLIQGPDGFSIDEAGLVRWTPSASQEGTHAVTLQASNAFGAGLQEFEILVSAAPPADVIDFNQLPPQTFIPAQDVEGEAVIEDGGVTLTLEGNLWRRVDINYTVTVDTVLRFEFKSTQQGEIQAIGLSNRLAMIAAQTFSLYGTQNWGVRDFSYTGDGEFQTFEIPVGSYFQGSMAYLFFAMDHDVPSPDGNSSFRNVQIFEAGAPTPVTPPTFVSVPNLSADVEVAYQYDSDNKLAAEGSGAISYALDSGPSGFSVTPDGQISWTPTLSQVGTHFIRVLASNIAGTDTQEFEIVVAAPPESDVIDFNVLPPLTFVAAQDTAVSVSVEDDGATLILEGNVWRRVDIDYQVTANTVLRFEFKSTSRGEVHGIGLTNRLALADLRTFSVFGTQNYGVRDFSYTAAGEYQLFEIPVGEYFQGQMPYLFFVMDHDVSNPTGNSFFKNVQIFER